MFTNVNEFVLLVVNRVKTDEFGNGLIFGNCLNKMYAYDRIFSYGGELHIYYVVILL